MNHRLAFNEQGTFKIVQLTDLHLQDVEHNPLDLRTIGLVERIIDIEQPDLIVFTGDILSSHDADDAVATERAFRRALQCAQDAGIPFAVIYGNHDSEKHVTRQQLQHIADEYTLHQGEAGPTHIHGTGNYVLPIQQVHGMDAAALLYFWDSGADAPEFIGGYAWIHSDQIHWYREQSAQFKKQDGQALPALGFMHIPLPEYREAWHSDTTVGGKGEEVCCADVNSGLFAALLDGEDVFAVFAGHDHDNDYRGQWHGIELVFGRVAGYNTYGSLSRGARVILLHEGERRLDSWLRLEDDTVMRQTSRMDYEEGDNGSD
ncbi:metallophosphoesterase family protein [Paenibacillus hunanensis]|uniref:metallophosphoesterase family protein n=1 Tax=Paenibacillus hunanensis TaxID=539262 RepID=UPI002A6B4479|nr:metallophosphoesterase family protein [Paenibacillus hunanensis]WPP42790.1 metallophosphoesterase family protein [Paenibacillus hunanensis]